jgi:DNA-binding beta-propeller fold protein YncE
MYRFKSSFKVNAPYGVDFDTRNQRLVVSNTDRHQIQLFDKKGGFISTFGSRGSYDGQFYYPCGLCLQPATNNIIVCEYGNHRLQVFSNPDGEHDQERKHLYTVGDPESSQKPGKFHHPIGMSCNNRGHIVVADYYNHRVQILDEKGRFLRAMGTTGQEGSANHQFYYPLDVCVDRNNHNQILVVDSWNERISIWSGDGSQFIRSIPMDNKPLSLTIDSFNRIIVGFNNNHRIAVFDPTNFNKIQTFENSAGRCDQIRGMCVTDDNTLVVCDFCNHSIQLFE